MQGEVSPNFAYLPKENVTYLPKDRSSKKNSSVMNSFPKHLINWGRLTHLRR